MKKCYGFTLLELMIAVAVVGILSSIAYPSYLTQVRKSRRASAQVELMNIAARQQQMLLDTRSYAATTTALNISPSDSVLKNYTLTITLGLAAVPTFTATAIPFGSQVADTCSTLSIDQIGNKSPASCW